MQYNAKKEMGDRIDNLPVDHILPSKEEREILNTLYDNDNSDNNEDIRKNIKDINNINNINNNINSQQRPTLTSSKSQEKKESYDEEEEEHYQEENEEYCRQVVKKPIKNNGKTTLFQELKLPFFLGVLFLCFNSNFAHQFFEKMLPPKFRTEIFCSGLKFIAFGIIVFITMNWGRTIPI